MILNWVWLDAVSEPYEMKSLACSGFSYVLLLNRHMVVTILRRCGLSLVRQAVVLVYQLMKQIVIICKAKVGIELRVELG